MLRLLRLRRRKRRHDIERERESSIPESWGRGVAKRGGMRDTYSITRVNLHGLKSPLAMASLADFWTLPT